MLTSLPKSSQKWYVLFLWQTSPFSSPPHLELSGPPRSQKTQTPCNHQAQPWCLVCLMLSQNLAKLEQLIRRWLLAHCRAVGAPKAFTWFWTNRSIRLKLLSSRFGQYFPSISSLGLSYPVLLYTPACQSRCCSSFHVTFPSLPWFQNLSWSPPGQKFRPFMASVEVSGWY